MAVWRRYPLPHRSRLYEWWGTSLSGRGVHMRVQRLCWCAVKNGYDHDLHLAGSRHLPRTRHGPQVSEWRALMWDEREDVVR